MATNDDLDAWISDARDVLDARAQVGSAPDLVDVVARAHRLAPDRVASALGREAEAFAPVVPLRRGMHREHGGDGLGPWIDDARAVIEADVEAHVREVPGFRITAHPPARRSFRRVAATMAPWVGVAAALGVFWMLVGEPDAGTRASGERVLHQALHHHAIRPLGGAIQERHHRALEPSRRAFGERSPSGVDAVAQELPQPPSLQQPDAPPHRRPVSLPARDDLRAWVAEAQARWEAGDLAEAERLLAKVTRVGGRSVLVEMAYADRFSLAYQRQDAPRRIALWSDYLERFPRGRFAEDARSGLCRAERRTSCWRAYLDDFPRGVYRAEAEANLESGEP